MAATKTHKAVVAVGRGDPSVLQLQDLPLPWPAGAGDVLVRLAAASVNPADAYFRESGPYIQPVGPLVLGHDGAGQVEAVGSAVTACQPGDRVAFCNGGIGAEPGTYAEYAVVPADLLAAVPAGVDMVAAAALPLVFITGWEALAERARAKSGEAVLIHGGAGGTGHVAAQIAVGRGCRVAATVSSAAKAEMLQGLGVERPILYREEDFVAAVLKWTGGRGVDVALDNIGGEAALRTLKCLAPYGRFVTLMGAPFDDADGTAYNRNLDIINVMMLTPQWRGLEGERQRQAGIVARGLAELARGALKLEIGARFPLARAAEAHRRLAMGGLAGKIVLTMGD